MPTPRFTKPKFDFRRNRILDPDKDHPPAKPDPAVVPVAELQTVADNLDKLSTKADKLLNMMHPRGAKTSIPVPDTYPEVRTAVQRLTGSGDGSKISWTVWLQLNEQPYDEAKKIDPESLLGDLVGDYRTDGNTIETQRRNDPLWGLYAQFTTVLLANRLLGSFSSVDTVKQTSTKLPPSSELPSFIEQLIVSFVTWQAVQGIGKIAEAQKKGGWSTISSNIAPDLANEFGKDIEDRISKAFTESSQALNQKFNAEGQYDSDRNLVVRYGYKFLGSTDREGYNEWIKYPQLRRIKENVNEAMRSTGRWLDALTVPVDIFRGFSCEANVANEALDRAAAVLNDRYAQDMICCFVRVMYYLNFKVSGTDIRIREGDVDIKVLKTFRQLLTFYVGVNSLFGVLDKLLDTYKDWTTVFRQIYERFTRDVVHKIFIGIAKPITDFMKEDDEVLKTLFVCTPFDEMLEMVLRSIEELESLVVKGLQISWGRNNFRANIDAQVDLNLPEVTRARRLIAVLDALMIAIQRGVLCKPDQVSNAGPDPDAQLTDFVNIIGQEEPYVFNPDDRVGDPFLDINPVSFETASGMVVRSVDEPITTTLAPNDLDECLRRIRKEAVPASNALERLVKQTNV